MMKLLVCSLGVMALCLLACGKTPTPPGNSTKMAQQVSPSPQNRGRGVLTREEVTAILGTPVTSMEGAATDMQYKTDTMSLETSVGIEVQEDSNQAMAGARKATSMLGGTPEEVPHLGDEAFFGAMSVLYVRKGDNIITITPPNFQQIAAMAAYNKVADAPLGSEAQLKALHGPDATQGALATIAAVGWKQGTPDEEHGRAIAVALAAKVVSKLESL
jgi:hypothetical protein